MTIDSRYVADLTDILAIQFECQNKDCGTRLLYPPDKSNNPPEECPRCNAMWTSEDGVDRKAIVQLLNSIRTIRQGLSQNLKVRLELPMVKE